MDRLILLNILKEKNVKVVNVADDEVRCLCPFHSDTRTSLSINYRTDMWICFRGCGRGKLDSFWKMLDVDVSTLYYEPDIKLSLDDDISTITIPADTIRNKYLYKVLGRRGVSKELVDRMGFLFCNRNKSIIAPVYDITGSFCGYVAIYPDGTKINHLHRNALYGLHTFKDNLKEPLVIVEGIFDFTSVYDAGFICGALLGSSATNNQIMQMINVSVDICLMLDNDSAGVSGTKSLYYKLCAIGVNPSVVNYRHIDKKDPNELCREEIVELVSNRLYNRMSLQEIEY